MNVDPAQAQASGLISRRSLPMVLNYLHLCESWEVLGVKLLNFKMLRTTINTNPSTFLTFNVFLFKKNAFLTFKSRIYKTMTYD